MSQYSHQVIETLGQFAEANDLYEAAELARGAIEDRRLIDEGPTARADVTNRLGVILYHLGDCTEARKNFDRAVGFLDVSKDAPESVDILRATTAKNLALTLRAVGDYPGALEALDSTYKRVVSDGPRLILAYTRGETSRYKSGYTEYDKGDRAELSKATEWYQRAACLVDFPSNLDIYRKLALVGLGRCYRYMGAPELARSEITTALQSQFLFELQQPLEFLYAQLELSRTFLDEGDLKGAKPALSSLTRALNGHYREVDLPAELVIEALTFEALAHSFSGQRRLLELELPLLAYFHPFVTSIPESERGSSVLSPLTVLSRYSDKMTRLGRGYVASEARGLQERLSGMVTEVPRQPGS